MTGSFHTAIRSGMRAALAALVKATSGPSLFGLTVSSTTVATITRTDGGSFVNDGVAAGDELAGSGWSNAANNGNWYVTAVSDASLLVTTPATAPRAIVSEAPGARVTLVVGLPSLVADENTTFTAQPGQCWWRETYTAGPEQRRSLGPLPRVRLDFLYAISVFYPAGAGAAGLDGLTDALQAALYPGRVLTYNGQSFTMLSALRTGFVEEADWSSVVFSARGFAYSFSPS